MVDRFTNEVSNDGGEAMCDNGPYFQAQSRGGLWRWARQRHVGNEYY